MRGQLTTHHATQRALERCQGLTLGELWSISRPPSIQEFECFDTRLMPGYEYRVAKFRGQLYLLVVNPRTQTVITVMAER